MRAMEYNGTSLEVITDGGKLADITANYATGPMFSAADTAGKTMVLDFANNRWLGVAPEDEADGDFLTLMDNASSGSTGGPKGG